MNIENPETLEDALYCLEKSRSIAQHSGRFYESERLFHEAALAALRAHGIPIPWPDPVLVARLECPPDATLEEITATAEAKRLVWSQMGPRK